MNDDKRGQKTKKLQLAIAWNKYDRVINDILTNQTASDWSDVDLDDALRNAFRRNSINFIDILIEYGASFQRLRRLINIADLYKDLVGEFEPFLLFYLFMRIYIFSIIYILGQ